MRGARLIAALITVLCIVPGTAHAEIIMESAPVLRAVVNQPFDVTFRVEGFDPGDRQISLPTLPAAIETVDGMRVVRLAGRPPQFSLQLRALQPGRYVLGAITVRNPAGEPLLSRLTVVEVFAGPNDTTLPLRARWRLLRSDPVVGQTVPVVLELGPIDAFLYPDAVAVQAPRGGLFEEVAGIGAITSIAVADRRFFYLPVSGYLFTPDEVGTATLPAARITVGNRTATADSLTIRVAPTGAAAAYFGAVGQFQLRHASPQRVLQPGQVVELELAVEGVGNLPVLQMPTVRVSGLVEIDRHESSRSEVDTTTLWGYRGARTMRLRFEPTGAEIARVRIEPFSWYDPLSRAVRSSPAAEYEYRILSLEHSPVSPVQGTLYTPGELGSAAWVQWHRHWLPYLFFAVGPLGRVGWMLLVARSRGRRRLVAATVLIMVLSVGAGAVITAMHPLAAVDDQRLNQAAEAVQTKNPQAAAALYALELAARPYHAGLHHNAAVVALEREAISEAAHHLRSAVRLAPERTASRALLATLEERYGLDAPPILRAPRADHLLAAVLFVWTALCWVGRFNGPPVFLLSTIMLALALAAGVSGFGWARGVAFTGEATVIESAIVRRIPDERAVPWVTLEAATSAAVRLNYQEYRLIRTRQGLEGWVHHRDLLVSPQPHGNP